jgi:hypothetical protein
MQVLHQPIKLYYHDDFDGISSAALLMRHTNTHTSVTWALEAIQYGTTPDTYSQLVLPPLFMVVDFQYHPQAMMWFDHHQNPFHNLERQINYEARKDVANVYWDPTYRSCAHLVYDKLPALHDIPGMLELAEAADYIDGALYASPQEYYSMARPEIVLNHALSGMGGGRRNELVRQLSVRPLAEIAESLQSLGQEMLNQDLRIIPRYRTATELCGDTVFSDLTRDNIPYLRYAPYLHYPLARYSIQMYRVTPSTFGISLSHNPWNKLDDSIDLSKLAALFGGGGHPYAASIRHLELAEAVRAYEYIRRTLAGT